MLKKLAKGSFLLSFLAPAVIIYTVFMFWPLITSLQYGFYDWNGYGSKVWAGFGNFVRLFTEPPYSTWFFNALGNNFKFFAMTMIIQNVTALGIAVVLSAKRRGMKLYRFLSLAPTTLSVVVVGFLWLLMYNPLWGTINQVLRAVGLDDLALPWLGDARTAMLAITVANTWQYIGIPILLFLAAIQTISNEVYEAAEMDGCTSWRKFRYVTLPLLIPTMGIVFVLTFVGNFSGFEIVYAMAGSFGGPDYTTDILGTLFYRTGFGSNNSVPEVGMAGAIASCMLIVIAVVTGAWFWLSRKLTAL